MHRVLFLSHQYRANDYCLLALFIIIFKICFVELQHDFTKARIKNQVNSVYHNGSVIQASSPLIDFTTLGAPDDPAPTGKVQLNVAPRHSMASFKRGIEDRRKADRKISEESLSTDCISKRNDILQKQKILGNKLQSNVTLVPNGYQKLKPKHTAPVSAAPIDETPEGIHEHVPECNQEGKYEPVQCHKIGYCWCVNKYGQAIKNTAIPAGEELTCEPFLYESESNDPLVVTGVTAHRMRGLLKAGSMGGSASSGNTKNKQGTDLEIESATPDLKSQPNVKEAESDFNQRVSASQEPSLSLVPNECSMSRANAKIRALRYTDNDSIWIPECDSEHDNLYAGMQCHKTKICWCVDQVTGLPLRANEQLTRQVAMNCTEVRKIADVFSSSDIRSQTGSSPPTPFRGLSKSCDAHKRVEFVLFLVNQFRQQISDHIKINPSALPPPGIRTLNPDKLSEAEVMRWKFLIMDMDHDDKLDDREWSKFKNNFRLIEKFDETPNAQQQQLNIHLSMTPLLILRSQRGCWRDFLELCGNGDILTDESVILSKWLSCTELPQILGSYSPKGDRNRSLDGISDESYAYSKEAAIARSKNRNPFVSILRPN